MSMHAFPELVLHQAFVLSALLCVCLLLAPVTCTCSTGHVDICRGGALNAHMSWLAVTSSRFSSNVGINGSAVAITSPAGIIQLHDTVFEDNHPRPGKTQRRQDRRNGGSCAL